jgi:large subunit ribosomal protein L4
MPKKMRRAAVRSALTVKAAESSIVVIDKLVLTEPKTRLMAKALNTLVGDGSALILVPEKGAYEDIYRSANNIPDAKVLLANYLNIRDLLQYDKLVIPVEVLDVISANFG